MSDYLVKSRGRMQWTTTTIKGPRKVWRWEAWRTVSRFHTLAGAEIAIQDAKQRGGLFELAVFHGGKRVSR